MGKAINYKGEAITEFIFDTAPAHRELKGLYAAASRLRTDDVGDAMQAAASHDAATRKSFDVLEKEIKEIDALAKKGRQDAIADFQGAAVTQPEGFEGLDKTVPHIKDAFEKELNGMEGNMNTFRQRMQAMDFDVGGGATLEEDIGATLGSEDPLQREAGLSVLKDMRMEQESIVRSSKVELSYREPIAAALQEDYDKKKKIADADSEIRNNGRAEAKIIRRKLEDGEKITANEQKKLDLWNEQNETANNSNKEKRKAERLLNKELGHIQVINSELEEAEIKRKDVNRVIEKGINLDRRMAAEERKANKLKAEAHRKAKEAIAKINRERQREKEAMRARNELNREFIQQLDAIQTSFTSTVTQSIAVAGAAFMGLKAKMDQVVGTFQEFEAQLINAQSIFQTSNDTLFGLSDQIVEFGSQYGINLSQASEGLYQFASAGLSAEDSAAVLQDTLKLSMAVQGDHNTIAKLTTQTIFGFGLEMSQSAELTDKFAHAINKSLIEYEDLASAVKFAMPFFTSTGQSVDQLLGSLQVLTNRALEAGIAGRGLRQALAEFAQHAEDNTAAFAKMGVEITNSDGSFKQLTEIAKEFQTAMGPAASDVELMTTLLEDLNVRGATAFVHLVQNADEFEGAVNDLQNSAGSATEMAEIQQASLENQIQRVKNAMQAPFLLSDEVGKQMGFLNEFSMVIHNVVSMFENLFVVIEDGVITGLTPMGEMMKQMAIESLQAFASIGMDIINMLKHMSESGQGVAGILNLMTMPLRLIVRLFGAMGTDVLQTVLTLKVLNGILPITNMMNIQNILTMKQKAVAMAMEESGEWAIIGVKKARAKAEVEVQAGMMKTMGYQAMMQASMFAMVLLTQKFANGNRFLAATIGALAGAMMGYAIAKQASAMSLIPGGLAGAVAMGAAAGAIFNTMLAEMMKPPEIDYTQYETSSLEMADTGRAALGGRHQAMMVEPGESIVSKTQNMLNTGGQGVVLNIQGDVYDGDNFAEKIGLALPDALRNADLGGTL